MKVTEFFLFFGPKLWSFRRGETEYGIKLIPIGAYVRIIGMNNLDDTPPEDEARTYRQQSFPKRMLVITAGSMMHFAQALVLFLIVFSRRRRLRASTDLAQEFGGQEPDPTVWTIGQRQPGLGAPTGRDPGRRRHRQHRRQAGAGVRRHRRGDRAPRRRPAPDRRRARRGARASSAPGSARADRTTRSVGFLGVGARLPAAAEGHHRPAHRRRSRPSSRPAT